MTIDTLILGSAALLVTACCLAACLRLPGVTDFLLSLYLIAFAEVVVVSLVLSPGRWYSRGPLLGTLYGVWFASLLLWQRLGTPRPPLRRLGAVAREALGSPLLVVLAAAVAGGLAYEAALAIGTAPNDYDALWYHLARAAFWKQQHAVSYIAGANDYRLNAFPPNAEIGQAFTMVLGGSERFAGLVQLGALVATMAAVAGIARRLGLAVRQAVFGALLFATLPVVALQASTSLNDLVFCSFLACCAFFLWSWTPAGAGLGALALALALGTKVTAFLALPVLALVAAFLHPRRRWPAVALAVGGVGVALGSYWYLVNLAETGRLDGNFVRTIDTANPHPHTRSVSAPVSHVFRLAIDAIDPSGAGGRDRLVFVVAAAVVLAAGATLARRARSRAAAGAAVAAAALTALPLAVHPLQHGLLHAYQKAWIELGNRRLAFLGFDRHPTLASPFQSWYGPTGFLLFLAVLGLVRLARRRRALPRAATVLALAPAVWIVLQAIATQYSQWDGRYVMFAVALAASLFGLALRHRPLAWAAVGASVTTLLLSLVHYDEKPAGVSVLGGAAPTSVWDLSRAQVLGRWFHPGEEEVVAALERQARKGETVALAIRREDVSYPYFGSRLDRFVELGARPAQWLVAAPGVQARAGPSMRLVVDRHGWRLYRHA
ncbi:MAG TPA: hypothetical protein VFA44_04135 [Gaiellaceae bacterium]|nr:hypothetical protein [Gaiellaceae bacterium]